MGESTTPHAKPDDMHGTFAGRALGYGYYWWVPMQSAASEWRGAFLASGHHGQFILGLPVLDLVLVHRRAINDERAMRRNAGIDLGDLEHGDGQARTGHPGCAELTDIPG